MLFNGKTMSAVATFESIGGSGGGDISSEVFTVENGALSILTATNRPCGVNAAGWSWMQEEYAAPIDEPYLNEWGYRCCLEECTEENNAEPVQIYKWLYRCFKEGHSVKQRTIVLADENGNEQEHSFYTDAGESYQFETRSITIPQSEEARFLIVPLVQFPNLTREQANFYIWRVIADNPQLCFPWMPQEDAALITYAAGEVMQSDGGIMFLCSVCPTEKKSEEMRHLCNEQAAAIEAKVYELYGIRAGDELDTEQREKVVKVIHDYIVLRSNFKGTATYYTSTVYAVFDKTRAGICCAYTNAFNFVARKYGIEALYMSGRAFAEWNEEKQDFDTQGGHGWVMVSLHDNYGEYSSDASKWSCIDLYWDEAEHFSASPSAGLMWDYFLNIENIFPPIGSDPHRIIQTSKGYGRYPTTQEDGTTQIPQYSAPYSPCQR